MNSQELIHPWGIDHWSSSKLSLLVTYSHCPQHILFLHWYYLVSWKTCLLCQAENTTQVFNTECPTEVVLHPSLIVRYNTTKTTASIFASCFFPIWNSILLSKNYLTSNARRNLSKFTFLYLFGYYPPIWYFHHNSHHLDQLLHFHHHRRHPLHLHQVHLMRYIWPPATCITQYAPIFAPELHLLQERNSNSSA